MITQRKHWLALIEKSWQEKSVLWLAGVRRVGKTFLCQSISDVEYFDCELPRIRRQMADPQDFLNGVRGEKIVLDEIHRLVNPSELLKIAADHYPDIKIIATGSSSFELSSKSLNLANTLDLPFREPAISCALMGETPVLCNCSSSTYS